MSTNMLILRSTLRTSLFSNKRRLSLSCSMSESALDRVDDEDGDASMAYKLKRLEREIYAIDTW